MLKRRVINPLTLTLLLGMVVTTTFLSVPWWAYCLVLLIWFLITLGGSFFIQWNYHLTSLNSNKRTSQNQVSITFDDGPNSMYTPKILALLKKYNAKATFFCVGHQVEKHPDMVKRILTEGHSIGNHTFSHSESFGFFPLEKVISELVKTKSIIQDFTGLKTNLYRPAFGVTNPQIEKAVKELKLKSIGWNVRSLDTTSLSKESILKRITSKVTKGDIVLLHDTSDKTVAVLEQLLVFLQQKNLRSVTVDQLLQIEAYA